MTNEAVGAVNHMAAHHPEFTRSIIVDPPTLRSIEPNSTPRANNATPNENSLRRLHDLVINSAPTAPRFPEPRANNPYQGDRILNEKNTSNSELLTKLVIHVDKPIENLPPLTLPELKLIGRRLCFNSETKLGQGSVVMKYVGLVATINKDAVMLMHVFRFRGNDNGPHVMDPDKALSAITKKRSVGAKLTSEGVEIFTWATDLSPPATNEPSTTAPPGLQPPMGGNTQEVNFSFTERHAYRKALTQLVCMGPIPFMTFSRSSINNVNFANDLPNSFFTLFTDPNKKYFDMQCLRMFCRRCIVHTVQNNNPQHIPLRPFIASRCNCPDIDDRLLAKVAREEVEHLVNLERAAKRAKKKLVSLNRNFQREYVPPSVIFSRTGVLYLTQIPQQTFAIGIMLSVSSLVLLLFYAFALLRCTQEVIAPYFRQVRAYICIGGALCIVSGAFSLVHSFFMSIFLPKNLKLSTVRFLFGALSVGSCFMMTIVLFRYFQEENFANYIFNEVSTDELSAYYTLKSCSGYDKPCSMCLNSLNTPDCNHFCKDVRLPQNNHSCRKLWDHECFLIASQLISVVLLLLIFSCFEQFMHFKLIYTSRALLSRSY